MIMINLNFKVFYFNESISIGGGVVVTVFIGVKISNAIVFVLIDVFCKVDCGRIRDTTGARP